MIDRRRESFCRFRAGLPEKCDFTKIACEPGALTDPRIQEMVQLVDHGFDLMNREAPPHVAFVVVAIDLRAEEPGRIMFVDRFSGDLQNKPYIYANMLRLAHEQIDRITAALTTKNSA